MKRRVVVSLAAQTDLESIYDYIAEQASSATALRYLERIYKYLGSFETGGERGSKRDDLRPGLRTIGFERRITIAFHIDGEIVAIDRVLYGGRDLDHVFDEQD